MNIENTFQSRLKELLETGGMNKAEIARKAGISVRSIESYLAGRMPRVSTFIKLADALGVRLNYLAGLDNIR